MTFRVDLKSFRSTSEVKMIVIIRLLENSCLRDFTWKLIEALRVLVPQYVSICYSSISIKVPSCIISLRRVEQKSLTKLVYNLGSHNFVQNGRMEVKLSHQLDLCVLEQHSAKRDLIWTSRRSLRWENDDIILWLKNLPLTKLVKLGKPQLCQ